MFFPVSDWFAAFVITLACELPVAAVLLRRAEPDLARRCLVVLVANLATHPIVWYVITQVVLVGTIEYTVVAETWAVAAEAAVLAIAIRGLPLRTALAVSVAANATSFVAGRLIGEVWPNLFR